MKSKVPSHTWVEIKGHKYCIEKPLSAPGDWWDNHCPIRRKEEGDFSYFIGMAIHTARGWLFFDRKYSMEPRLGLPAPTPKGPFKNWEDAIG